MASNEECPDRQDAKRQIRLWHARAPHALREGTDFKASTNLPQRDDSVVEVYCETRVLSPMEATEALHSSLCTMLPQGLGSLRCVVPNCPDVRRSARRKQRAKPVATEVNHRVSCPTDPMSSRLDGKRPSSDPLRPATSHRPLMYRPPRRITWSLEPPPAPRTHPISTSPPIDARTSSIFFFNSSASDVVIFSLNGDGPACCSAAFQSHHFPAQIAAAGFPQHTWDGCRA